jgi:hypothetical protein
MDALEKLIDKIFVKMNYNTMVRPSNKDGVTVIFTELKLLQVDLVCSYINMTRVV